MLPRLQQSSRTARRRRRSWRRSLLLVQMLHFLRHGTTLWRTRSFLLAIDAIRSARGLRERRGALAVAGGDPGTRGATDDTGVALALALVATLGSDVEDHGLVELLCMSLAHLLETGGAHVSDAAVLAGAAKHVVIVLERHSRRSHIVRPACDVLWNLKQHCGSDKVDLLLKAGVMPACMGCIDQHAELSGDAVAAVCNALCEWTVEEDHLARFDLELTLPSLIPALSFHRANVQVVFAACTIMSNLAFVSEGLHHLRTLAHASFVELLSDTLRHHWPASSPQLLATVRVCKLLITVREGLRADDWHVYEAAASATADLERAERSVATFPHALAAMQNEDARTDGYVALQVCDMLRQTVGRPALAEVAINAGAGAVLAAAMQVHGIDRPEVMNHACWTVWKLAEREAHASALVAAEVIAAQLRGQQHASSDDVYAACGALTALTSRPAHREVAAGTDAAPAVLHALCTHKRDETVAAKACWALVSMVQESTAAEDVRGKLIGLGAVDTVTAALVRHKNRPDVARATCSLLDWLTAGGRTRCSSLEAAARYGTSTAVVAAVLVHGEDKELALPACWLLWKLSASKNRLCSASVLTCRKSPAAMIAVLRTFASCTCTDGSVCRRCC